MKKTSKILFAAILCSLTLMNSAESCDRSADSQTAEQNPIPVDSADGGPSAGPGIGSGGGGAGGSSSHRR